MTNPPEQKSIIEKYIRENDELLRNNYLISGLSAGIGVLGWLGAGYFKISEPESIYAAISAFVGSLGFVSFLYGLDSAEKIKGNSKKGLKELESIIQKKKNMGLIQEKNSLERESLAIKLENLELKETKLKKENPIAYQILKNINLHRKINENYRIN